MANELSEEDIRAILILGTAFDNEKERVEAVKDYINERYYKNNNPLSELKEEINKKLNELSCSDFEPFDKIDEVRFEAKIDTLNWVLSKIEELEKRK